MLITVYSINFIFEIIELAVNIIKNGFIINCLKTQMKKSISGDSGKEDTNSVLYFDIH